MAEVGLPLRCRPRPTIPASIALAFAVALNGCTPSAGSSSPGSLTVAITGIPAGTAAAVTVLRPNGVTTGVVATTTLNGLAAGTYTVQAVTVIAGPVAYVPAKAAQQVTVSGGATTTVSAVYAVVPASLQLIVTGLPNGIAAPVAITGPNGYSATATQSVTLTDVPPGSYTITSASAIPAGILYQATPPTLAVSVAPGAQVVARVQYSHPESSLTLTIDQVYVTQGAQGGDGSVPLVADRPGMLRVFLTASATNVAAPEVRVRLYSGSVLTNTYTMPAPAIGVPAVTVEADGSRSWNLPLAEHLIQPGMQLLIDVDPAGLLPLATRANLTFPTTGIPQAFTVLANAPYNLTFVPVTNAADGGTGDITVAGIPDFTNTVKLLHPMWAYNAVVHAPFTFSGGALQSNDGNFAWQTLLQQIEALRQIEGGSSYFYGVVHPTYSSGIVGLGYVGAARFNQFHSAIGWDSRGAYGQLGTYAGEAYAHELGHNLSLNHAPCGGAGNPDPAFPFPGGGVGRSGYNVVTGAITANTNFDVMGYCAPTWISDYSYRRILSFVAAASLRASLATPVPPQRVVVVSGSLAGGHAQLFPAIEVVARATLPSGGGDYQLEGRDVAGNPVFAFGFTPASVADGAAADLAQFVFTVPLADGVQLAQIRLTGPGIDTAISAAPGAALRGDTSTVTATRLDAGRVRLEWSAARYPVVMVRDGNSGEVLAFGRGGSVVVRSGRAPLSITASDGVQSTVLRLTP